MQKRSITVPSIFLITTLLLTVTGVAQQAVHAASTKHIFSSGKGQPHFAPTRHDTPAAPMTQTPLTYHGGATARTSVIYLIFWEPPTLQDGTPTYVSSTYNSLIQQYFSDVSGSSLYNVNTQYYDTDTIDYSAPDHIQNSSTLGGVWVDTSAYPPSPSGCVDSYTPHGCVSDKQLQNEVTNAMSVNGWSGGVTHLFFIFTSWGEGSCHGDCAFSNFCAYHWSFTNNGQPVVYANLPYSGTDLTNCGVPTSPNNDFDADSDIDWASHEEMEMITDPVDSGWLDAYGGEIGDKCGYKFGSVTLDNNTANQEWNEHFYLVQMEWSNAIMGCAQSRMVQGAVYTGSDDTKLYALDAGAGAPFWSMPTQGSVVSSPAIANGVSYIGSNDGSVYAFNASSGTQLWSYATGGPVTSSPLVVNGIVYVGSSDGSLYALSATSGKRIWRYPTGGPIRSSPTIAKAGVIIGSDDGNLYALKANTGKKVWSYQIGAAVESRPKVSSSIVYVGAENGQLYALNATYGTLVWSATTGGLSSSSPAISGKDVYIGSTDGSIYAFATSNGALAWSYQTGGAISSSPEIVNNVLYIGSSDFSVYALNSKNGALLWTYKTGGAISSSPTVIDGILYIGSSDMNVYALWADDGSLIWQYLTGGNVESSPAVVLSSF